MLPLLMKILLCIMSLCKIDRINRMQRPRMQERLGYSVSSVAQPTFPEGVWNLPASFNVNQQRMTFNSFGSGNLGMQGRMLENFISTSSAGIGERNLISDVNGQLNFKHVEQSVVKTIPSVLDLNIGKPVSYIFTSCHVVVFFFISSVTID